MKLNLDIIYQSPPEWVDCVLQDFDAFLQDHADCERKASGFAMSMVAKYPDRLEIIPELIETALEEMEHFKLVYEVMEARKVQLAHSIPKDLYMIQLMQHRRSGREDHFLDRLCIGSVVETRGAERFKLVAENLEEPSLQKFYKMLWASEAKHGNIYVKMALNYFPEKDVYERLEWFQKEEGNILASLPVRPALH